VAVGYFSAAYVAYDPADSFLNALISPLTSYTVLYTTTPSPQALQQAQAISQHQPYMWEYDAEEPFPSALHTDLKRDLYSHARRAGNSSTSANNVPLFEKYNFLGPGTTF